jgi:hypothetical protein
VAAPPVDDSRPLHSIVTGWSEVGGTVLLMAARPTRDCAEFSRRRRLLAGTALFGVLALFIVAVAGLLVWRGGSHERSIRLASVVSSGGGPETQRASPQTNRFPTNPSGQTYGPVPGAPGAQLPDLIAVTGRAFFGGTRVRGYILR